MDIIELIKLFLKSKGVILEGKMVDDKSNIIRNALSSDFNKNKISEILVSIPELGIEQIEMVLTVDLLQFKPYGIAYDMENYCFAITDDYRGILDENDLSIEWQNFCIKNKGLVYKTAVAHYIDEEKRLASEKCHKETLKCIDKIKRETENKNQIIAALDDIQEDIFNRNV